MPIQLRHQTQPQRNPAYQGSISDGGYGAASRALNTVARASGSLASRFRQKEHDLNSARADRMAIKAEGEYSQALYELQEAEQMGDKDAILEARNRVAAVADYNNEDYADWNERYGDPDDPVPEKYLQPKQNGLFRNYQDFYYRDKAQKIGEQTQQTFEGLIDDTIYKQAQEMSAGRLPVEGFAENFKAYKQSLLESPIITNANEELQDIRKKQILEAGKSSISSLQTRLENTTDKEGIQEIIGEMRTIAKETDVLEGKEQAEFVSQTMSLASRYEEAKTSEEGYKESLDMEMNKLSELMSTGRSIQTPELVAVRDGVAAIEIPETSRNYDQVQDSLSMLDAMIELGDPAKREAYFQAKAAGETTGLEDKGLSRNAYNSVKQYADGLYKPFQEASNGWGRLQSLSPRFDQLYTDLSKHLTFTEDSVSNAMLVMQDAVNDLGSQLEGDYVDLETDPPFFAQAASVMSNPDMTNPEQLRAIQAYRGGMKQAGLSPAIAFEKNALGRGEDTEGTRRMAKLMGSMETVGPDLHRILTEIAVYEPDKVETTVLGENQRNQAAAAFDSMEEDYRSYKDLSYEPRAVLQHYKNTNDEENAALWQSWIDNTIPYIADNNPSMTPEDVARKASETLSGIKTVVPFNLDSGIAPPVLPGFEKNRLGVENNRFYAFGKGVIHKSTATWATQELIYSTVKEAYPDLNLPFIEGFDVTEGEEKKQGLVKNVGADIAKGLSKFVPRKDSFRRVLEDGVNGEPVFHIGVEVVDPSDPENSPKNAYLYYKQSDDVWDVARSKGKNGARGEPIKIDYDKLIRIFRGDDDIIDDLRVLRRDRATSRMEEDTFGTRVY